mgnify:CR=1 FL=1
MEVTYINFINKKEPTDIFTCSADNDKEAFHILTMYVSEGYDFEIYNPLKAV